MWVNAFTPETGAELYKSDGTTAGTVLLNDIRSGPDWSFPNAFFFKNNVNYFIGDDEISTALYKTDATPAGLQRIIPYLDRVTYFVVNFNITDNGQAFYILGNRFTGGYELWHSDGTDAGTYLLNANLYYNNYVVTIGNTGYFVAGDFDHGYELWKSDGTPAGTKLLKDIYPGPGGSYPYSLFAYKKDVYFAAYSGGLNFSLWISNGTEKGTVKLKDVTPAYFNENFADPAIPVFCVSGKTLYFTATDFNTFGAELWKTNGTEKGTVIVKDINPVGYANPSNLTDVNGNLFFTADDGVHGTQIWTSDGSSKNTQMVTDISYSNGYHYFENFCSAGGKLYFVNHEYIYYPVFSENYTLWSSDGTAGNTNQVNDPVVNGLSGFSHLTAAGNKLFFGGYSPQYGAELYEGDATNGVFVTLNTPKVIGPVAELNAEKFDAILYPNPTTNSSSIQIKGNVKDVEVTMTDIVGKVIWHSRLNNPVEVKLPVEKVAAGVYMLKVISGTDIRTLRLVKQ